MGTKNIRAGRAEVEVTIKDRLAAGFARMRQRMAGFAAGAQRIGGGFLASGAALGAPLIAAAAHFATSGDELTKMHDRTGASVESLSELRHAAAQSSIEFETLGKSINKQQKIFSAAKSGDKAAIESFDRIGLSVEALKNLSSDEQFATIADQISQIEDPADRAAAAMSIFGKSGADLLPLLNVGKSGISALRKEARDLGLQVSGKDAAAATLLGDTWSNVKSVAMQSAFAIGSALAPSLIAVLQAVTPTLVAVIAFIQNNRQLVLIVAGVALGLAAVGAGFLTLGTLLALGVTLWGAIGSAISIAGTIAAAILSPIGIVIGLLVAGGAAWLYFSGSGATAITYITDLLGGLLNWGRAVFGGIYDSIVAGDWAGAGAIMWTALKIAWRTGVGSLMIMWTEFRVGTMVIFDELITSLRTAWANVTTWIADKIIAVLGLVSTLIEEITGLQLLSDQTVRDIRGNIQSDNEAFKKGLAEDRNRRDTERGKVIADTRKAYSTTGLQQELDGMIAAAKENRAAVEANKPEKTKIEPVEAPEIPDFDFASKSLKGPTGESFGSFSASVLQGNVGPTLTETKKVVANTAQIVKEVQRLAASMIPFAIIP